MLISRDPETGAPRRPLRRVSTLVPAGLVTLLVTGLVTVGLAAPSSALRPAADAAVACDPSEATGHGRVRPGFDTHDPDALSAAAAAAGERATQARLRQMGYDARSAARRGPIRIAVRWNILMSRSGEGAVSDDQIRRQMRVMNRGFAGETDETAAATPFVFHTEAIRRVRNDDWHNWGFFDDDFEAKRALAVRPQQVLNMYVADLEGGLLGYAFYPFEDVRPVRQGVVLLNESLPGGNAAPFNLGDTATHEVGHWLGLAHTFDNSCNTPGDYVGDTPYQFEGDNIFSCDESLDTCDRPGRDPVHNFMSYGDDFCLDRFTPGQRVRMVGMYDAWRGPSTTP